MSDEHRSTFDQPLIDTQPACIVMLAAIIGGCGLAIVLVLAMAKGLERIAQLERGAQATQAAAKERAPVGVCEEPRKAGDRAVIVVRREGQKLAIECAPLLDWRDPARTLKPATEAKEKP